MIYHLYIFTFSYSIQGLLKLATEFPSISYLSFDCCYFYFIVFLWFIYIILNSIYICSFFVKRLIFDSMLMKGTPLRKRNNWLIAHKWGCGLWIDSLLSYCQLYGLTEHAPTTTTSIDLAPLTLLRLHPFALQQADVEPLLCVLVSDVFPGSQRLKRVPGWPHVTRRTHRPLVLLHCWSQPFCGGRVGDNTGDGSSLK